MVTKKNELKLKKACAEWEDSEKVGLWTLHSKIRFAAENRQLLSTLNVTERSTHATAQISSFCNSFLYARMQNIKTKHREFIMF